MQWGSLWSHQKCTIGSNDLLTWYSLKHGQSTLGSIKRHHCLLGQHQRLLAHIWGEITCGTQGLLQCGLDKFHTSSLYIRVLVLYGTRTCDLEFKETASHCAFHNGGRAEHVALTYAAKEVLWLHAFHSKIQAALLGESRSTATTKAQLHYWKTINSMLG